jgi:hypothetical protein
MRGRTRRAALLLLVTCEGCNSNLAARYLSKTTAPLCDAEVPSRAVVEPPFKVPSFGVSVPGEQGDEVLDMLRCCVPSHVFAPLEFGYYALAIRGGADDGACDMLVETDLEGGYVAYECHAERPDLWGGWTEGTTPPTATLREHCEVVEERGPS